ncbi:MAG: hypothetical protein LBL74_01660 [Bacteroidales bacterium]|jgi:hypothetical protein|nr:hypothetical protein [Bacteroidales bacterium]
MKKVLLLLAVAGLFVACQGKGTETPTETATETPEQVETVATPTATATESPVM